MLGVPRLAVPQICYTWKLEEFSKLVSVLLAVTIENLKKKNECEKKSRKIEKHILKRRGGAMDGRVLSQICRSFLLLEKLQTKIHFVNTWRKVTNSNQHGFVGTI